MSCPPVTTTLLYAKPIFHAAKHEIHPTLFVSFVFLVINFISNEAKMANIADTIVVRISHMSPPKCDTLGL